MDKFTYDMIMEKITELNDLKVCGQCGNVFSKTITGKTINRCPACNVWKKETT